jgi:hypothetical protein
VLINLEEKGQGAEALDAGKTAILNALHATLGAGEAGKQDFNAAGSDAVADVLDAQGSPELGTAAGTATPSSLASWPTFRDKTAVELSPILGQLSGSGASASVIAALRDSFYTSNSPSSMSRSSARRSAPSFAARPW